MRKGNNPQKEMLLEKDSFTHLVVVPVYIPQLDGYYAESFRIFKNCILSLQKTVHAKTFISVVNNGSCSEVIGFLNKIYETKIIHEVVHTENIGKINAILKGLAGHTMPLVTIADADILFKAYWQVKTQEIFNSFPKAIAVSILSFTPLMREYSKVILLFVFLV